VCKTGLTPPIVRAIMREMRAPTSRGFCGLSD